MLRHDDAGQSSVEFVLVLPLVMVLLLGMLQGGLFLRDHIVVTNAAREGAREAAVTADTARIRSAAQRAAPNLDLSIQIERGRRRGDATTVRVKADATRVPVVGAIVAGKPVRSAATMRVERSGP